MDPRLEFTFQLLIDGSGLPRSEIMDHVFEGNMVHPILQYQNLVIIFIVQLDEINQLFLPHMRNKLMWFYQEVDEPEVPQPVETVSQNFSKKLCTCTLVVVVLPGSWLVFFEDRPTS